MPRKLQLYVKLFIACLLQESLLLISGDKIILALRWSGLQETRRHLNCHQPYLQQLKDTCCTPSLEKQCCTVKWWRKYWLTGIQCITTSSDYCWTAVTVQDKQAPLFCDFCENWGKLCERNYWTFRNWEVLKHDIVKGKCEET